ncbi:hypothetical protein [Vibrio sp. F74]|uniref:hypothetical protein n=1 Tax=Vibrio sp. F74 TaxID=700020 RepID=UPI0035F5A146
MKFFKVFVSLLFVLVLAGCGRVQPILDVENTPVAYDLQKKQVKMAIIESATNRGWVVKNAGNKEVELELDSRGHKANVRVPYSEKFYSILYVSSENLKADAKGNIHRNYNRWVNNLNVDIQKNLSFLSISK